MADSQDSVPLSGPLQSKAKLNQDRLQRWVERITARVVEDRMAATYQQIGSDRARLQQDLTELSTQIQALRQEIKENRAELLALNSAYDEYRQWGESVAKSVASTEGDARTIEKTMGRVDTLVEIAQLLLLVLEPMSRGVNWMINRLHGLNKRTYSGKDGVDITGLVKKPRRRGSDR